MLEFDVRGASVTGQNLIPTPLQHLLPRCVGDDLKSHEISAVLLLCDLSGFSRLGAETVRISERGAEDLRAQIDRVFGAVSERIEAFGGGILYFAGDAVVALWTGATAQNVEWACACGLAIQDAVSSLSSDVALSMKAGVTVGKLWVLDVPGADARVPLVIGDALTQFDAMALAEPGVRLSKSAMALRGVSSNNDAVVRDAPALPDAPVPSGSAGFDAGPWLRQHERAGLALGDTWKAEFRQAHVLVARLPKKDAADASDVEAIGRHLQASIGVIADEDGTLVQICRDDKGLVLIAAWGLAQSVMENGAERAVFAAKGLADHGAQVSVTTGKLFFGLIGAGIYRQFVIVGDAVNRAASLSGLDEVPLLIDSATQDAVSRRFDTHLVGQVSLKGQPEKASVFGVREERLRGLAHASALVGRKDEIAALKACAQAACDGSAQLVSVIGDAGMGKSRLAVWFAEHLKETDLHGYEIHADRLRRTVGYWPLKPLIAGMFDDSAVNTPEKMQEAVCALLPEEPAAFLPLLNPILPVNLPETEDTRALTGAGRAERTRRLIAELLAAALPNPAFLIVEDAHWLDSATWQVLDALAGTGHFSIGLIARPLDPLDLPTEARRFLDEEVTQTLHLTPLSEADAGNLAARVLDASSASDALAALLFREATGHPLFTGALALALHARGIIRNADGVAHLVLGEDSLEGLVIPPDAAGAVQEQIAQLEPQQQILLKTASTVGREFSAADLVSLASEEADSNEIAKSLREIADTGLIEPLSGDMWRFHHAIVADAAYTSMTTEQAQALHLKVAAMITGRTAGPLDLSAHALLAHHYERAGQDDAALDHLTAAAEAAKASYANLEVINYLTRSMRLAGEDAASVTQGQWRYDIAYALRALGQYQRAEDFLKVCISGLDKPPPETGGQAARALIEGYAAYRLRPHRAPQPKETRDPIILVADATMMLSEIHYELNKIPFALAEILRGANLARRAGGDSATLAKLYIGLALISTSLPWALNGDALQSQALGMVDRLDDPATEAWVYMVSGNYEASKAGWTDGERYFQHSMSVADRCGERKTWETSASTLANLKRLEGRFDEARAWSNVTLQHSRDRGIMQGIIWSHNGRARDLLCLSEWDTLREDVAALDRYLSDTANASDANDNNKLVFHYTDATLQFYDGKQEAFLQAFDAALDIVRKTKRPQVYMTQNASFYSDLTWAMYEADYPQDAVLERQKLIAASARRVGRQYWSGVPMADLCAGDLAWMTGKPKRAEALWRVSVAAARERGMYYNAAQALDRLTRVGLQDLKAERDAHLSELGIALPKLWRLGVDA